MFSWRKKKKTELKKKKRGWLYVNYANACKHLNYVIFSCLRYIYLTKILTFRRSYKFLTKRIKHPFSERQNYLLNETKTLNDYIFAFPKSRSRKIFVLQNLSLSSGRAPWTAHLDGYAVSDGLNHPPQKLGFSRKELEFSWFSQFVKTSAPGNFVTLENYVLSFGRGKHDVKNAKKAS